MSTRGTPQLLEERLASIEEQLRRLRSFQTIGSSDAYIPAATFDAVGDLIIGTGPNAYTRLAREAVGDVLTVTPDGLAWSPGAVDTVDAPVDAEYVVTAAHPDLTAERVIDLGAYSLLTRRAAVNAEDDHFNLPALAAKWLPYTGANPTVDLTDKLGWCKLTNNGYKLQPVPAGDWTIETECIGSLQTTNAFTKIGLIITGGTTATSTHDWRVGFGMNNNGQSYRLALDKFVNNVFSSNVVSYAPANNPISSHWFQRIRKVGGDYQFDWSFDPFGSFQRWQTLAAASVDVPITHFGFGADSGTPTYFNYFLRY